MEVSAKFLDLVKVYAAKQITVNAFKAVTIAQWILESGRGESALFMQYNNAGGIKWRKEMLPFGEPIMYKAHDGSTEYVNFRSLESFIDGYWAFINRSIYDGWKNSPTPEHYIRFIAQCGYCPTVGYADEVLALVPFAEKLLSESKVAPKEVTTVKLFNISNELGVVVYKDKRATLAQRTTSTKALLDTLTILAKDVVITMANKDDIWPGDNTSPRAMSRKKVMVNAGHAGSAGATGTNKAIKEEYFNALQAKTIQEILNKNGIMCDIINQDTHGGLSGVGKAAKDYDIAIALHFNAADGVEHGVEWLGGSNKPATMKFAEKVCRLIATTYSYKYRGMSKRSVTVTSEFDKTACPIAFLIESEFIDDEVSVSLFTERVINEAKMIADCIMQECKQ